MAEAPTASRPSAAASLAPELLHIIFAPLSQPAILAVAAVCSLWRACAIQHPMYYRHWAFLFPPPIKSTLHYAEKYADMGQLEHVVGESEVEGCNLGLTVFVHPDQLPPCYRGSTDTMLVPILQRALERCVVLNFSCDSVSYDRIFNGLSRPAPLLRRLTINIGDNITPSVVLRRKPIPARFLSADAPRLEEVYLSRIGASSSSPCFPSVHTLLLYRPVRIAAAHAAFPSTKRLTIICLDEDYKLSEKDHTIFNGLEALFIGPDVEIPVQVPALKKNAHIPLIEYHDINPDDVGELVPASGDISMHIFEHVRQGRKQHWPYATPRIGHLCVEFMAGGLIRRVDSDVPFADSCGFVGLGPALCYIIELKIDDRHLRTLMGKWKCFPALRILRITLITWVRPAPGVALTPAEEIVYGSDHVRSQCACLGGLFSDHYDGSCPDGDVHMELISLQTLELCATRPYAVVPMPIMSALSRSFGPRVHLVLSNGLALSEDAARPLFASITSSDASFFPTLPCVARAAALMEAAASERKDALQDMDHALRKYGAGFHWDHCHEPSPISREDPRLAVM